MGQKGVEEHLIKTSRFYKERRDKLLAVADKHLTGKKDL